ncbi:hypothetical protein EDD17DRAFT_1511071 [Pisolithus thermaeus]|nr:hypothetical protein EDD17DRAFT_1511071 [Pisolithus thermaeus]
MAKAIFLHDETEEFQSLAGTNLGVFTSSIHSCLDVLKMKYQKQNALLGQTGAGRMYEDLLSNNRTKNILAVIMKDFPWWADLHRWWCTNPAYNNTFSAADVRQDFAVCAVELFKLQLTPPAMDPETHLANLTVPCSSTPSGLEDGEIKDDEGFSGCTDLQLPSPSLALGPLLPPTFTSEQHSLPHLTATAREMISLNNHPPIFAPNHPQIQPSHPSCEWPWDHWQKAASVPNTEESSDSDIMPLNFFSALHVSSSSPSSPFPSDDSDSKPSTSKQTRKCVHKTPTDRLSNNLTSASMTFVQQFQQMQQERSQVKHHHLDLNYWKAQAKVTMGQEERKFQLLAQHEKHVHELAMGTQEVKKMELAVQLEWLHAQNLTLQRGIAGGEDQGISGDQDVHPSPPSV